MLGFHHQRVLFNSRASHAIPDHKTATYQLPKTEIVALVWWGLKCSGSVQSKIQCGRSSRVASKSKQRTPQTLR